jgi:ABC-2 type transport system permease protein
MRTLLTLLNRELRSYFYQPIAYVVMFFLLLVAGFNFWIGVQLMTGQPSEFTVVELAFNMVPFWIVFILSFPLLTMRTYSEEYRQGTFETLTTAPVTDWQVVLSKFLGALGFYCVLWAPTFIHFAIFQAVAGQEQAAVASGAYIGAYLLLLLMGMFFIALGCLASSLVKDQVNAAVICMCAILIWFFLPFVPEIMRVTRPDVLEFFKYFSAAEHMRDFAKGLIDSRQIVWYLSATVLLLVMNFLVFQRRKWKA